LPAALIDACDKLSAAQIAFERDDLSAAHRLANEAVTGLRNAEPNGGHEMFQRSVTLYIAELITTRVAYERGDYAAAEQAARAASDARKGAEFGAVQDSRDQGELATWLSMSLARQGRLTEAAQTIAPVLKLQRSLAAKNHGDQWLPYELAAALYAQALADTKRGPALLREAASLIDRLPPSMRDLHDIRQSHARIQQAQGRSAARIKPASAQRSAG
jgi:hypothetical protein